MQRKLTTAVVTLTVAAALFSMRQIKTKTEIFLFYDLFLFTKCMRNHLLNASQIKIYYSGE